MKKLSIVFVLLITATSANAVVIGSLGKITVASITFLKPPAPVSTPPANIVTPPAAEQNVSTPIPEQNFVIFTEETKQLINEIVNCVDVPNEGGHDNVSAVPVPASLPLMATALGIFGITRRRKTFK
ncbi:VPLPA-CTERM sorting domain-containing protein [Methylotenera sp. 1P/1]|uniref:VPLPA-CTERM sorting domain-containing protein n=1 Tax=Methylotenera sp. 1P/1 TaxID=1131551 RepID=UPI00037F4321|nr:VPLPA-CTERM sorting domain-containing protein [Methylotenera sp. 1P/1]